MTRKLFYEAPEEASFQATVVSSLEREKGIWAVTLDATAFYPTGGGQPHDRGRLGGAAVLEVLEEEGQVVHLVDGPVPEGKAVTGEVDWTRRTDHRQQHTGQHILSRAFENLGARTVGFHLGEHRCSIDLDRPVSDDEIRRAEDAANQVALEDREVQVEWHQDETTLPSTLRQDAPEERPIRLIRVADFDVNPCCGTHCARTGQVGVIKVLKSEKKKEGSRVEFICGGRALADYQRRHQTLRGLALELTTDEFQVPERVLALKAQHKETRNQLDKADKELLEYRCREWAKHGESLVVKDLGQGKESHLGTAAAFLREAGASLGLLYCRGGDQTRVVFASNHPDVNAGTLLGPLLREAGGRGGGNQDVAQGALPADRFDALVASLRKVLEEEHGIADS